MKRQVIISSMLLFFLTTGFNSCEEPQPVEAGKTMNNLSQTLSLTDLAKSEWTLRYWSFEDPAPVKPRVTLKFENERIVGSSGCNSYSASIEEGDQPGRISVGPIATTRMMCPETEMNVEFRFLRLLASVSTFKFGKISEQPEDQKPGEKKALNSTPSLTDEDLVLGYRIEDDPYKSSGAMYFFRNILDK